MRTFMLLYLKSDNIILFSHKDCNENMICGIGIDMVEIARIARSLERFGAHFIQKILAPEEIAHLTDIGDMGILPDMQRGRQVSSKIAPEITAGMTPKITPRLAARIAARFAAKEAAGKALGTGLAVGLHNIHIYNLPTGQPHIQCFGAAAQKMHDMGAVRVHVSLSHERGHAVAMVVLEGA